MSMPAPALQVLASLSLTRQVPSSDPAALTLPPNTPTAPVATPSSPPPKPPVEQPPAAVEVAITPPKPAPAPKPKPWQWTPLRDSVEEYFRTHLPDLGMLPVIQLAVMYNDEEWISRLVAGGVNPDEATPGGDTPLCAAIRLGATGAVRALLYGGADPRLMNFEKQPPITLASLRRGSDILHALIAAGADPNTRFNHPVAKSVLERVTIKDLRHYLEVDRGLTPLIACASRGDVEGAAELLKAGAKASLCTTRYKRYPINFAATQGYLFLMRIILGRQPESEPRILVTVDLGKQRAWVTKEGQVIDSCPVSTGRAGYATPAGRYVITDKHRSWTSTLYHVSMPFFMRLNCGAIGLHSGYVTGRPASHGCIRLPYDKAKKFFEITRVGDEVQIIQ
ncbi:MAG TPA: L,D-transpeptidase family protein [Prosthecobacter sp.]|nr:L,D-transpeptidase family protein [Prosthecobacter sp.]HRK13169.1 L,D-transpeptidase family protein [Prosthecobacter sp.]